MSAQSGMIIAVHRGGCEVFADGRTWDLRLLGKHAQRAVELAVGDDVSFDPETRVVIDVAERRTRLARLRPRDDPRREHVIAANMDRLAVVASVREPAFRPAGVDRFILAGLAGGLEVVLVANKVDLLEGRALPDEVSAYESFLPVLAVSATQRIGLEPLVERLAGSRTVFWGISGVGKSSLLNALEPELRIETRELRRTGKGRHTTTRATLYRLPGGALVVDTPGVREIATGPLPEEIVDEVFPDIAALAAECRFRNCRHTGEPDCAVRDAAETGSLAPARLRSYLRLRAEARG